MCQPTNNLNLVPLFPPFLLNLLPHPHQWHCHCRTERFLSLFSGFPRGMSTKTEKGGDPISCQQQQLRDEGSSTGRSFLWAALPHEQAQCLEGKLVKEAKREVQERGGRTKKIPTASGLQTQLLLGPELWAAKIHMLSPTPSTSECVCIWR